MVKKETTETEDVITIKKSELDAIMKRLDRVEYASDNSRTSAFDQKHRGKVGKTISVRSIDGKIIKSWKSTQDLVQKNLDTMKYVEIQTVEVTFLDGKTKEMPLSVFSTTYEKVPCKVISQAEIIGNEETDENGNKIVEYKRYNYKLTTPNGETIEIEDLYVN